MKNVRKRALLSIVALALLLGVVIYMTYAWYTRMTGMSSTEFKIARWDFNANYQIDSFRVNVYEYQSIYGHNIAAPGTAGTLDLLLNAETSDTDVSCVIQLDKSSMSEEFQKRVYFYYMGSDGILQEMVMDETPQIVDIAAHSSATTTLHWRWVYDYDEYLSLNDNVQYYACSRMLKTLRDSRVGGLISLDDLYMLFRYTEDRGADLTEIWNRGSGLIDHYEIHDLLQKHGVADKVGNANFNLNYLLNDNVMSSAVSTPLSAEEKSQVQQYCRKYVEGALNDTSTHARFVDCMARVEADSSAIADEAQPDVTEWRYGYEYLRKLPETARNAILRVQTVTDIFKDQELLAEIKSKDLTVGSSAAEGGEGNVTYESYDFLEKYIFGKAMDWDENKVTDYESYFTGETPVTLGLDAYYAAYEARFREFDDFDTRVGANPEVFKQYMAATVYVVGEQVKPEAIDPSLPQAP